MLVAVYENRSLSPSRQEYVLSPHRVAGRPARRRQELGPKLNLADSTLASTNATLSLFTTMATWCPACNGEIPDLRRIRKRIGSDQLAMSAVPLDDGETDETLAAYQARNEPPYRFLQPLTSQEIASVRNALAAELGRSGFPATLITDSNGRIVDVRRGTPTISDIRKLLHDFR